MTEVHLSQWLDAVLDDNAYCRDLAHLRYHYEKVPVFIYGCERQGFSEHYRMCGAEYLGYGFTCTNFYELYISNESEPVAMYNPVSSEAATLFGELFSFPVNDLPKLDSHFSNGIIFTRRQAQIRYFTASMKSIKPKIANIAEAYVYTGVKEYWKGKNSFELKLARQFVPNAGTKPYYIFTSVDDGPNRQLRGGPKCL